MEGGYNNFMLWQDMVEFSMASDEPGHIPLHEAGHLSVFEKLTGNKAMYGWTEIDGVLCPCVTFPRNCKISPVKNLMISMAGDICSMISLGMDVPETCLALYRYFHPLEGNDWDTVRALCVKEDYLMKMSKDLGDLITAFWDDVLKEYKVADIFFNMFERIPDVIGLIDSDDRTALEKMFGRRRGYKTIRGKLLDPREAWGLCQCPNRGHDGKGNARPMKIVR